MKKVSTLMEELGFDPQGSDKVKKAFVKNLIQAAQRPRTDRRESQLSLFDLEQSTVLKSSELKTKKAS